MRPVLARTSSAASGLRFCGMIEEPVVNLSDSCDEADQRRGPDHDLLGEARQMHRADRGRGQRLQHEVAVGHGIERIRRRPVEAERLRRHVAVDRKRRAGERRRAERAIRSAACARRRSGRGRAPPSPHRRADDGRTSPAARVCRWVKPGITVAACSSAFSASAADSRASARIDVVDARRAPRAGSRSRPGRCASARCAAARPAAPISSASRALDVHVDVFERALERELAGSRSLTGSCLDRERSCGHRRAVMMPCFASIAAWALLAAMSWRYRCRSKSIEALISSMIGVGARREAPAPHLVAHDPSAKSRHDRTTKSPPRHAKTQLAIVLARRLRRRRRSGSRGYTGSARCSAMRRWRRHAARPPELAQTARAAGPRRGRRARRSRKDAEPLARSGFQRRGRQRASTLADWRGKTVLLNLWATWCVPCRKEMPALDALQAKLGGPEFEVVAVNIDTRDPHKPKAWLKEVGIARLGYLRRSVGEGVPGPEGSRQGVRHADHAADRCQRVRDRDAGRSGRMGERGCAQADLRGAEDLKRRHVVWKTAECSTLRSFPRIAVEGGVASLALCWESRAK